jgi:hypothetical protein
MLYSVDELRERFDMPLPQPHFSIIGDVHGCNIQYLEAVKNCHCSFQVGDFVGAVEEADYTSLLYLDPNKHVFIGGNHEPYTIKLRSDVSTQDPRAVDPYSKFFKKGDKVYQFDQLPPHHVGHYGVWQIPDCEPTAGLNDKLFFMRGAWSIDKNWRTDGVDWFEDEELTYAQGNAAIKMYGEVKPDFVVTHACPQFVQSHLRLFKKEGVEESFRTRTGQILEAMHNIHRPKIWVFGHYHQDMMKMIEGTLFVCLDTFASFHGIPVRMPILNFDKNLRIIMR